MMMSSLQDLDWAAGLSCKYVFLQIVNIYIYADFMCAISTSEKGGHQAAAAAENMDLLMVP